MANLGSTAVEVADYRVTLLDQIAPTPSEWRNAAIGTVAFHLILIIVLLSLPTDQVEHQPERKRAEILTPLIDPPTRLTQKAPNTKPLSEELTAGLVEPSPPVVKQQIPQPRPKKFAAPPPPQQRSPDTAHPALPQEPPQMATTAPNATALNTMTIQPPPATVQQPKLVLEQVAPAPQGQGTGRLKIPGSGVEDAVREIAKNGPSPRSVGDDTSDQDTVPRLSPNPTPSPTRPKTSLELMSDPEGVDFKPYMLQVLQAVRRNWFAVMPESVRLGQRGRVLLQFAIAKDGKIIKVVFSGESGIKTLDRAAVAALTASDPLPQLPAAFKGDRVVLQFTFLYNAPQR